MRSKSCSLLELIGIGESLCQSELEQSWLTNTFWALSRLQVLDLRPSAK